MALNERFELPQDITPLTIFKTAPFSQTWVIEQKYRLHITNDGTNNK